MLGDVAGVGGALGADVDRWCGLRRAGRHEPGDEEPRRGNGDASGASGGAVTVHSADPLSGSGTRGAPFAVSGGDRTILSLGGAA